ncbi:hypothetical protein N7508_004679 [Penicillium antarcticum]|uniref:uncharacterized protein n=1 Tax=Penicillium antarcticum TaxID=416450 RepID=UPI00239EFA66|nr:uncharacterized protein N7508_004679 [Penicillium antarcticum]KAJ5305664.1 hypothetical protein N7508_004679 [Penicillium antarcticum]
MIKAGLIDPFWNPFRTGTEVMVKSGHVQPHGSVIWRVTIQPTLPIRAITLPEMGSCWYQLVIQIFQLCARPVLLELQAHGILHGWVIFQKGFDWNIILGQRASRWREIVKIICDGQEIWSERWYRRVSVALAPEDIQIKRDETKAFTCLVEWQFWSSLS